MSIDGSAITALIEELYPICRSITGDGLRATLRIIGRHVPLQLTEVPTGNGGAGLDCARASGTSATPTSPTRRTRGSSTFERHNLHVVNYSAPVRARMSLAELRPHLHTLPAHPDWIPYRTSYYDESWGFCLTQRQLDGHCRTAITRWSSTRRSRPAT